MASLQECEAALHQLSAIIAGSGDGTDRRLRRSVCCRVTDLEAAFVGQLRDGDLQDIRQVEPPARGDITITTASDDLLALVDGTLGFGTAWTSGRVKIDASFMDLLRLRKML